MPIRHLVRLGLLFFMLILMPLMMAYLSTGQLCLYEALDVQAYATGLLMMALLVALVGWFAAWLFDGQMFTSTVRFVPVMVGTGFLIWFLVENLRTEDWRGVDVASQVNAIAQFPLLWLIRAKLRNRTPIRQEEVQGEEDN
jgi:hypothetical protein